MARASLEPRISTRLVRPVLRLLRERGAPIEALVHQGQDFDDPEARIPFRLACTLLERAAEGTGDPALGLHAATELRPGDFDALEFAAMSSGTVLESILTVNRHLRLLHDAADFTLEVDGATAKWRFRFSASCELSPQAAEYVMGILVVLGREHAGPRFGQGGEARFVHARPRSIVEHKRILRMDVRFGQSDNVLVLPAGEIQRPLLKSGPALKSVLERMLGERLRQIPPFDDLPARLRGLLAAELQNGTPTLEHLAGKLQVSSRTIRRYLDDLGTTHRDLLRGLRKELAMQYLRDRSLRVSEVALLLGYSEPTAFQRAFRRWTGATVAQFRARPGEPGWAAR
jgi:AraC-like DNA-binding protein